MCSSLLSVFFFKQKTAYEMRISDWSSDVCSSDLRILALGRNVAVDELDDRHRRRIRRADAGLDDAGIAALAIGVTRAEHVEQLGELRVVEQAGVRKAAVGEAALLGERDQLFDIGAKLLGFRDRGRDLFVLDERCRHVAEQGDTMGRGDRKSTRLNSSH